MQGCSKYKGARGGGVQGGLKNGTKTEGGGVKKCLKIKGQGSSSGGVKSKGARE